MRQSNLFTKTRKETPADETAKNAKLLIQAGFIHKEFAGVYSVLPLGLRVINKIKSIISEEMKKIGSTEIIMSTLQNKEIWQITDRWDDNRVDIWFKSALKNGNEVGFGWSHEEPITNMMKYHIGSYKDLPRHVHQFQNKLRNEIRSKSGIMRSREFIMKDMYSFSTDEKEHMDFYNKVIESYFNIFNKVGLGDVTYITSASGGVFTDKFSHEFQTICSSGEDNIYVHKDQKIAINEEIFTNDTVNKLGLNKSDFEMKKAAEIGNIFTFGTEKCDDLGLYFIDKDGNRKPVFLGSYGIGITRVMGVISEVLSDDHGLVWPKEIAPFNIHIVRLGESENVKKFADSLYEDLEKMNLEVLYDDRDLHPGEKFADSDLIGIPVRFVISEKTVAENKIEVKLRTEKSSKLLSKEEVLKLI